MENGQIIVNVLWNAINQAGSLDVAEKTYNTAAELSPMLQAKVQTTPEVRVLVRADKEVKYAYLKEVLRVVGRSGIGNVTFSVVDKETSAAPAVAAP